MAAPGEISRLLWRIPPRNRVTASAYVFGLILAVALSFAASRFEYFPGDLAIAQLVQSIDYKPFEGLMWAVSDLGTRGPALAIPAVCAIALALKGQRLLGLFLFLTISSEALDLAIKALVHRPRPDPGLVRVLWPLDQFGFPSGHAMNFVVLYGFIIYLVWTRMQPSFWRTASLTASAALIVMVGISRVYLGAHWPSDVLGGYLIGVLWLVALIRAFVIAQGHT